MSDDKFDAIIVGAGIAGCIAAYVLARAGADVLVVERGSFAGAKNMTGGRLYAHSLEKIIPGFAHEAPIERKVIKEKVSFLTKESGVTLDYHAAYLERPIQESYTILRSDFDQWLMGKAEDAGAQFVPGVRVDELAWEGDKVVGIKADGDILESNVVILAEGVNAILSEKIGMAQPIKPAAVAVGVKELIELPRETIEERFHIQGQDGVAWLFAGEPSNGLMGGGFVYTNESSISLGLVCGLHHIGESDKSVPQMLEDFKNHPVIKPLIAGGKLIEYSAHVVPEAGLSMMPELVNDGVLIVGDAAGLCINAGYTIRGMDLAVASGEAAAKAVLEAKEKQDFTASSLSTYKTLLNASFVMSDMRLYSKLPEFLETPRIFNQYPQMVANMMADLFTVGGDPAQPLYKKMMRHCKKVGYMNLMKDALKGVRSL